MTNNNSYWFLVSSYLVVVLSYSLMFFLVGGPFWKALQGEVGILNKDCHNNNINSSDDIIIK